MPFDPNALLIDFAIVSLLLVVGQFIRAKVKFIQSLFLPASVIAGVIALILGPQFLDILPFRTASVLTPTFWWPCCLQLCFWAGQNLSRLKRFCPV